MLYPGRMPRASAAAALLGWALVACSPPGEPAPEPPPRVVVGLERLADDVTGDIVSGLAGKRLGLVVHGASITTDGRHATSVLLDRGLDVARLFSPEHGLRGQAAAGEAVDSGLEIAPGRVNRRLPVVSLYGERKKPAPEDLEGLDALVFDLQGAGVRFYTYVSTMMLCLEAAGEAGVEFVVLDRPNPLGGEQVAGPVAAPRQVAPASFVNLAPGPLVHGLTMGEMARLVNAGREQPARLTVVAMTGWRRAMTWADTGRRWVAPSPNLRSADAALAYPGTALFEAGNVSEGRGTATPFLILGAPWVDPVRWRSAAGRIPGFHLSAVGFTPRASPAAPSPKFLGRECSGLEVRVTDPALARPYRLGLTLVVALARQPGFEWRRGGEALTWLLGTPRVYRDLAAGESVEEILAADRVDHVAWRAKRRASLLYP